MKKSRAGFTFIEIMVSMAILVIVVGGIYSALYSSQSFWAKGITRQEMQDRVRKALYEMSLELRQASAGLGAGVTFATAGSAGDETVTFSMCTGFAASIPTWSTPITYTTVDGDGDPDDGADNNNNRMTDERKLVRQQTGRPTHVIADNVKEGSVRFTRTLTMGMVDRIQIQLTLLGVDDRGRIFEETGQVTVDLRNQ